MHLPHISFYELTEWSIPDKVWTIFNNHVISIIWVSVLNHIKKKEYASEKKNIVVLVLICSSSFLLGKWFSALSLNFFF